VTIEGVRLARDLADALTRMARLLQNRKVHALVSVLLGLALVGGTSAGLANTDRRTTVVIDPGHGGADFGASGEAGVLEKDVVLRVSERIGRRLVERGFDVVFTRETDDFISLPERTDIANRARGDLFLSIHANSAASAKAEGPETYFLSVKASDAEAMRVAMVENQVFRLEGTSPDDNYIVGSILGDLIRTEHLRISSEVATVIQRNLANLGVNRGVKQAPFVVLVGVNMPAALVELGFLTHPDEERRRGRLKHQTAMADAIVAAVASHFETHNRRDVEEAHQ
jgi:N-acetylmuramoyl-L-alanine amidase